MLNKTINDIRFIREIDLGGFSSVWLAVHEITNKQLAVKVIPKFLKNGDNSNGEENKIDLKKHNHFQTEIQILSRIDHPLVLGFFGNFEDEENLYICMEYVPNGSLLDYVNAHSTVGGIKEVIARHFFTELLITIEYLHKKLRIFHRDLKCENVLIDSNNNIRLIDFGFSVIYDNASDTFTDKFGSEGYTCPEMINNVPYTPEKSDIWCLGIILYSMLVGKLPFDGSNDIETAEKIAFEEPQYPEYLSKNSIDLLKKILTKNPYRRIDFDSIKKHPFLSQTELSIISRLNPSYPNISRGLDQDIVMQLSMNQKVDATKISLANFDGEFNGEMLMYKQLKRLRDTKLTQEIVDGKIISFNSRRSKKHIRIDPESSFPMMPTSSSMPFNSSAHNSNISESPITKFAHIKSTESTTDISDKHHDYSRIPLPENKKNMLEAVKKHDADSACDNYVEDTIIDEDEDDPRIIPKITSTPNFFFLNPPSESENESESISEHHFHSNPPHRAKHKPKSKKQSRNSGLEAHVHAADNIQISFPSTSYSVSSLSSLSKEPKEQKVAKKDTIKIAPRRRSRVGSINGPKNILSFIH